MLLVNLNGKPYMGSPIVWLNLTLVTLKCQCQGFDFESLYHKRVELSHIFVVDTSRKPLSVVQRHYYI